MFIFIAVFKRRKYLKDNLNSIFNLINFAFSQKWIIFRYLLILFKQLKNVIFYDINFKPVNLLHQVLEI